MHFIEHIIEPPRLLLAWQTSDEKYRTRYIVAELYRTKDGVSLVYLKDTEDFRDAQNKGFESYPAFPQIDQIYDNVLDAFMRRLPPRARGDFSQYLAGIRLKPDANFSDFALLGYSGTKLPSDGFSIIHPFNNVDKPCELLIEAAGYRHIKNNHVKDIIIGTPATFTKEFNAKTQTEAISITAAGEQIGYVNRGLILTFTDWMNSGRIADAWIEKINGTPGRPMAYIFVKIAPKKIANKIRFPDLDHVMDLEHSSYKPSP